MQCPSCKSPLEPTARFCGVCGHRLQGKPAPVASGQAANARAVQASAPRPVAPSKPAASAPTRPAAQPARPQTPPVGAPRKDANAPRPKPRKVEDPYLGKTLNGRFHVESKIGEGGFGAVYRGVQLATGRKVALKLLHPEMTKDENLVARFRREGMVLCNLRDAHTITTYDFDQTPEGDLYIAMELLEGKSLHQVFHDVRAQAVDDQSPKQSGLEWRRMFKILTEMCSSLAEAHQQGIVHRDLKPENVYLESRPGNPEFVKILDFGIAKVMRGDTIDPQSPQLTATGQTLGTLEYMSPEQLMGKPLDGRSDVYALGVVAYEMITGQLPFPEAKGPAGLITAQLKQTPIAPSKAHAGAQIPDAADRVILKCLEKDKNNRYADVTQLAHALQEVITHSSSELAALAPSHVSGDRVPHTPHPHHPQPSHAARHAPALIETRRGDPPHHMPPPMPMGVPLGSAIAPIPAGTPMHTPMPRTNAVHGSNVAPRAVPTPPVGSPVFPIPPSYPQMQNHMQSNGPTAMAGFPQGQAAYPPYRPPETAPRSRIWIWWVIGLLALGAATGAVVALLMGN